MLSLDDDDLVAAAGDAALAAQEGRPVPSSVTALLRAIASTRAEAERRRMADAAAVRAGQLGDAALRVLRVAIFALA